MSFQWIIDKAETLSIRRRKIVATTVARDGTTRAVSRGTPPRVIEVKLPDGLPWTEIKDDIASAEALDKITTAVIAINHSGYDWYYGNTGGVIPGSPETYTVRCIEFPDWTIFARDQVTWSGPFIFQVES